MHLSDKEPLHTMDFYSKGNIFIDDACATAPGANDKFTNDD